MVSDLAIGPYVGKETGEMALLRELLGRLNPGDILLADRYYCSYFMICLLLAAKVDFVTRLHQRRTADFRRGTRLGPGDHMVVWSRPPKPEWMDQATYEQMPESIECAKSKFSVAQPGFRVEMLVVVTTLTDARRYTREDIAELYHRRWLAELDIRAIKVTMGMDVLRREVAGDGAPRNLGLLAGLQSDPANAAGLGLASGPLAAAIEFHRRDAKDRGRLDGRRAARGLGAGRVD